MLTHCTNTKQAHKHLWKGFLKSCWRLLLYVQVCLFYLFIFLKSIILFSFLFYKLHSCWRISNTCAWKWFCMKISWKSCTSYNGICYLEIVSLICAYKHLSTFMSPGCKKKVHKTYYARMTRFPVRSQRLVCGINDLWARKVFLKANVLFFICSIQYDLFFFLCFSSLAFTRLIHI